RTFCTAGRRRPIRTAIMAITTSNSMRVNPLRRHTGLHGAHCMIRYSTERSGAAKGETSHSRLYLRGIDRSSILSAETSFLLLAGSGHSRKSGRTDKLDVRALPTGRLASRWPRGGNAARSASYEAEAVMTKRPAVEIEIVAARLTEHRIVAQGFQRPS